MRWRASVTEQFRLEQVRRDGRTIELDEGAVAAGAVEVKRARDQFLARPRLAGDQHRGRNAFHQVALGVEQLPDLQFQVLHRLRFADHLVQAALARLLPMKVFEGFLDPCLLGYFFYQQFQLLEHHGLGEVIAGTRFHRLDRQLHIALAGDHDDTDAAVHRVDLPDQLQPVGIGQAIIEQHDIGFEILQAFHRRLAGGGDLGIETGIGEITAHVLGQGRLVLDDQDGWQETHARLTTGISNITIVPLPTSLCSRIPPPCLFAIRLASSMPMPRP